MVRRNIRLTLQSTVFLVHRQSAAAPRVTASLPQRTAPTRRSSRRGCATLSPYKYILYICFFCSSTSFAILGLCIAMPSHVAPSSSILDLYSRFLFYIQYMLGFITMRYRIDFVQCFFYIDIQGSRDYHFCITCDIIGSVEYVSSANNG